MNRLSPSTNIETATGKSHLFQNGTLDSLVCYVNMERYQEPNKIKILFNKLITTFFLVPVTDFGLTSLILK